MEKMDPFEVSLDIDENTSLDELDDLPNSQKPTQPLYNNESESDDDDEDDEEDETCVSITPF